jgi:type VI secretion system protein ImpM
MPRTDLSPGFYGKLPAAGDFVIRRLPPAFVRAWDRWCARHLVPRLGGTWPPGGIRFLHPGPVTGVVVPSTDRAFRPFPLTLAAAAALQFPGWYDALAELAANAATLSPDALDLALCALPASAEGSDAPHFLLWTTGPPIETDPEAPQSTLDVLLAQPETG